MSLFRAFVAGLVVPSIVLPIAICIALTYGNREFIDVPILHFIPIIWGIWNLLYFAICKNILPGNLTIRYLLTGGILGFLLALVGIFWVDLPQIIGFPLWFEYYPLIFVPIIYAILWRLFVKPLNTMLGLEG